MSCMDPQVQTAISEIEDRVRARYPGVEFSLRMGIDDPEVIYITAVVDVDDPDEVLELVVDRLLALQLDEHIPIYLLPVHPPRRVAQTRARSNDPAALFT